MKKLGTIVFFIIVNCIMSVDADSLVLKDIERDIEIEVVKVTDEFVNGVIQKKDLKSLEIQFSSSQNFPDRLILNIAHTPLACKIEKVTQEAIYVLIPNFVINSLRMSFPSEQLSFHPETSKDFKNSETEEINSNTEDREMVIKNEIIDELRLGESKAENKGKHYRLKQQKTEIEFRENGQGRGLVKTNTELTDTDRNELVVKKEIERSGGGEVIPLVSEDSEYGKVKGRLLYDRNSLKNCQVKLQRIEKDVFSDDEYSVVEKSDDMVSTTNEKGRYKFSNVPPGKYKIYWKFPSDITWSKNPTLEPDVVVTSGKLVKLEDIETMDGVLPKNAAMKTADLGGPAPVRDAETTFQKKDDTGEFVNASNQDRKEKSFRFKTAGFHSQKGDSDLTEGGVSETVTSEDGDITAMGLPGEQEELPDPVPQDPQLGRVGGRITKQGEPLPECRVKLAMLEESGFLNKEYQVVKMAIEPETVTDEMGEYHFKNIPPGLYKLYWKPPSETEWIRRFKMEPDVTVEAGKLTQPKDIETLKRTLN